MSIYTKPLSQLQTADLQELLQDRAIENVRLEFKREVASKEDTLKKLSSFANTFGGFMVVGASANSSDGRIDGLPGVEEENGYKQKLVDWCSAAVSPPMIVEVSDPVSIPGDNGRFCYVVSVPESDIAPHFLNGRKGIWIRTDEFSTRFEAHLADERELRLMFDRRKLTLEQRKNLLARAKRRFDTYSARMHTDLGGTRAKSAASLEFCVVPRYPVQTICEQAELRPIIVNNTVNWRGGRFPRSVNNLVSQHESAIVLLAAQDLTGMLSIFEVNVWGMLFYGTEIEGSESGVSGIHIYRVVGCVLLFIRHASTMLKALGYSGPLLIETSLTAILGTQWIHAPLGMQSTERGSELDDEVAFSVSTTTEMLSEQPDRVAIDVLRYLFFSVNLSDMVDTPAKLDSMIAMGYRFNAWP